MCVSQHHEFGVLRQCLLGTGRLYVALHNLHLNTTPQKMMRDEEVQACMRVTDPG